MRDDLAALMVANFPGVNFPAAASAALARLVSVRRLAPGAVLFATGEVTPALYGVLAGEIEVRFTTLDGQVSVIDHVLAPRLFGLASFASGLPSTYEAVATRPTRVAAFGPTAYAVLVDDVPGVARLLLQELALRHDGTLRLLEAARHLGAIERFTLAMGQLQRGGRIEAADAAGWQFLRATQAELAALAGLSRQTVNELIAGLAQQGRLRPAYGGLWLKWP